MIKIIKMYGCTCDHCGISWKNDQYGWVAMTDEDSINECVNDADWFVSASQQVHLCPECYYIDDNDELCKVWERKDMHRGQQAQG